jgi:hypothetical protein
MTKINDLLRGEVEPRAAQDNIVLGIEHHVSAAIVGSVGATTRSSGH